MPQSPQPPSNEFSDQANAPSPGLVPEFLAFLKHNKKWWLVPIVITLGLVGLLILMSSSAVAPLLYPLF